VNQVDNVSTAKILSTLYTTSYERNSLGDAAYGLVRDVTSDFKNGTVGTEDMMARMMAQTTNEWPVLAAPEPAFLAQVLSLSSWFGQKYNYLSVTSFFTCLNSAVLANMASTAMALHWFNEGRAPLIMRTMNNARRNRANDTASGGDDGIDKSQAGSVARVRQHFDEAIKAGAENEASTVKLVTEAIVKTIAEM
jgi:hypothetical protein